MIKEMAQVHMSEAEVAKNFAAVLKLVGQVAGLKSRAV
jgi:hypothetical protein